MLISQYKGVLMASTMNTNLHQYISSTHAVILVKEGRTACRRNVDAPMYEVVRQRENLCHGVESASVLEKR